MHKNIIIATAGHIDHGKTTLIKALTGDETDRLAAEKERGISIENGFSQLLNKETRAKNLNLGIIDVPGHEKFVNKMLTAAAGVDIALIVIAADEGIMPQTKEHLAILNLLDVSEAVIVITKIDLVDLEWIQLVEAEIKEEFKNTFAEKAEIIKVSSTAKIGISNLKETLISKAFEMKSKNKSERLYFPIDRVFSLKGLGTVVTGTLFKGILDMEKEVSLYPANKNIKIRSLENHNKQVDKVGAGGRVGINLSGLKKSEIAKGNIIAEKNSLLKTRYFAASLKVLNDLDFKIKNGDQIHFHSAALETMGTIYLYGENEVSAGQKKFCKLILENEVSLYFKQKFVIRRCSPLATIGGGEILEIDPLPQRKKNDNKIIDRLSKLETGSISKAVEILISSSNNSAVKIDDIRKKLFLSEEKLMNILEKLMNQGLIFELNNAKSYFHLHQIEKLKEEILEILNCYHQKNSFKRGIKKEELRSKLNFNLNRKEIDSVIELLIKEGLIKIEDNLVANSNFEIRLDAEMIKIKNKILNQYKDKLFTPPSKKDIIKKYNIEKDFFDFLESQEYLIRIGSEFYFHHSIYEHSRKKLESYFQNNTKIDLGRFRDLIQSSRRYSLPLLEKLESLKIIKNIDDLRYPGENLKTPINLLDEK